MQKIDTTSLPAPDSMKNNWEFAEVWIDAILLQLVLALIKEFYMRAAHHLIRSDRYCSEDD
ncbi:MAG: hypothetical protein V7K81_33235 [Nostoc sp.]